jgi:hypothetical protein
VIDRMSQVQLVTLLIALELLVIASRGFFVRGPFAVRVTLCCPKADIFCQARKKIQS